MQELTIILNSRGGCSSLRAAAISSDLSLKSVSHEFCNAPIIETRMIFDCQEENLTYRHANEKQRRCPGDGSISRSSAGVRVVHVEEDTYRYFHLLALLSQSFVRHVLSFGRQVARVNVPAHRLERATCNLCSPPSAGYGRRPLLSQGHAGHFPVP